MPQASDELRVKMSQWFHDPVDDSGPTKYLQDAGYVLTSKWYWKPKPGVRSYEDMTHKEFCCMLFLVQEWDFGGLDLT